MLKNRYGKLQLILSADMIALIKLSKFKSKSLYGLRNFYNDVKSNVKNF